MDKLKKFFQRLPPKDLRKVLVIINRVEKGDFHGLDVKKLSGYKNIFRVRVGYIRVLFLRSNAEVRLISIERRSDTTYNL